MTAVVNRLELAPLDNAITKESVLGERLDLVEHVTVKLTVALGEVEMPLGKLFALSPGEVLALDSDVDAPVDLKLHGKVVGRGQLVAAGDKFGVRVTELASGGSK